MCRSTNSSRRRRVTKRAGETRGASSLETRSALRAIAAVQRANGIAAFISGGRALDARSALRAGVDLRTLLAGQAEGAERALDMAEKLVSSGAVDLVVIHVGGSPSRRGGARRLRALDSTARRVGSTVLFITSRNRRTLARATQEAGRAGA